MKSLIISTAFFILTISFAIAQEGYHEHNYSADGLSSIELDAEYGDVIFEAWDQDEVLITGKVVINGQPNSQVFEISEKRTENVLRINIRAELDDEMKTVTIRKSDGSKVYLNQKNITVNRIDDHDGDSVYYGVDVDATFTIKVPRNMQLYVSSTYGDVELLNYFQKLEVENTYGSINAKFSYLPSEPSIYLNSTYSHVDVGIPASTNAKLSLQSGYGKIFTDLNFEADYNEKGTSCPNGEDITGTLNNGDGSIRLKADYNNIYLREISSN